MDHLLNNKKPNINLKYSWRQLGITHYKIGHHFILIINLLLHCRKFQCPSVIIPNFSTLMDVTDNLSNHQQNFEKEVQRAQVLPLDLQSQPLQEILNCNIYVNRERWFEKAKIQEFQNPPKTIRFYTLHNDMHIEHLKRSP